MEWTIDQENTLLIGSFEESFYQLGVRDKERWYQENHSYHFLDKIGSKLSVRDIEISDNLKKIIGAYAEGIEMPYDQCLTFYANGEAINIKDGKPRACGSFSIIHRNKGHNQFYRYFGHEYCHEVDRAYRSTLYNFAGMLKVAAIHDWHYPHPHSFAINEKGLVLSYGSIPCRRSDSRQGILGSDLFQELCFNAHSIEEVISQLKGIKLYSNGQIVILDQQGKVLEIIWGDGTFKTTTYSLESTSTTVFSPVTDILTEGIDRHYQFHHRIIDSLKNELGKKNSESSISKLLLNNNGPYAPINLTTSKLAIIENNDFCLKTFPLEYPYIQQKKIFTQNELWEDFSRYEVANLDPRKLNYDSNPGHAMIQKAQLAFDQHNLEEAYHQIQMGIDYLHGHQIAINASFFFIVWQYMKTSRKTELRHLYLQLESIAPKLSDLLADHHALIALRLEKVLGLKVHRDPDIIHDERLRSQFRKDQRTLSIILEASKKYIRPRLDTFDIHY